MTRPTLVRVLSSTLFAAFVLGCGKDTPSGLDGPFLEVTSPGYFGLLEGSTMQLDATLDGQPAAVTWSSNNTNVITVSPTGVVTAVGAGMAAATAALVSDPTKMRSASFTITSPPTLTSGTAVTNLSSSGARGSTRLWKIIVPSGATTLTVTLSGGTGDVDLYVKQGSPPTITNYDCASENGGNGEVCNIANPAAGTWFVMLALWDPYSGVTLKATVTP